MWGLIAVVRGSNEPEPEISGFCSIVAFALSSCPILIQMQCSTTDQRFWNILSFENLIFCKGTKIPPHSVVSPRFPWRVKRTTVIRICQDELLAAVLCGILSEWETGTREKKNGVGGSIWELVVATVKRQQSAALVQQSIQLGGLPNCTALVVVVETLQQHRLYLKCGAWCYLLCMACWVPPWWHQWWHQWWATSPSVTCANLHSGWQLRHLTCSTHQWNAYNMTYTENWCSVSNLERVGEGGGGGGCCWSLLGRCPTTQAST